jgi:hypothetical protein
MLHKSSNQKKKPDEKIPPVSFPFPVPNLEKVEKHHRTTSKPLYAKLTSILSVL